MVQKRNTTCACWSILRVTAKNPLNAELLVGFRGDIFSKSTSYIIIPLDVKRENLVENSLAASKLNRGASLRAAAQLRPQPSVYLDGSEDSPHESKGRPEFIMVCLLQPREV